MNRFVSGPPADAGSLDETAAIAAVERQPPGDQTGRHATADPLAAASPERASGEYGRPGPRSGDYSQPGRSSGDYRQPGRSSGDYRQPGSQTGTYRRPDDYSQPDERRDLGYRESYQEPGYEAAGSSTAWQHEDQTSAWPAAQDPRQSAWPTEATSPGGWQPDETAWAGSDERHARPASERDRSDWPAGGQQRGWPNDRLPGEPRWHVPGQQPWPDQDDELSDEMHHGRETRDSRTSQAWGVPVSDDGGEEW